MRWVEDTPLRTAQMLEAVLRKATEQRPDDPEGWRRLGRALADSGKFAEAIAALTVAAKLTPEDAGVQLEIAKAAFRANDLDIAQDAIEAAMSLAPGERAIRISLFHLFAQQDRIEDALAMAPEIAAIDPADPGLVWLRRKTATSTADLEAVVADCDAVLERRPGDGPAIYGKAMALARLGRDAEACALMAPQSDAVIGTCETPAGYGGMAAFCAAVGEEIRANETFIRDRPYSATRQSEVSASLERPGNVAIPKLLAAFRAAVERRASALPGDSALARSKPESVKLHAWAIRSERSDAKVSSHFHGGAWMSGVFYVNAPRPDPAGPYLGPLIMGSVGGHLKPRATPPWPTPVIEPVPGRLVLFPSYMPHAAEAPGIDGERISVSFDVLPVG